MRIVSSPLQVSLCAVVVAVGVSAGCSSMKPLKSVINDVSVAEQLDSGYTVVAVDGAKVVRAKPGKEASVAPVVIVEPGLRTLTLEPKAGASGTEPLKIAATLEPAKTYRIGKQADGSLTLVEHGSRAPTSYDGR